jgi:hypothetical protein
MTRLGAFLYVVEMTVVLQSAEEQGNGSLMGGG